MRILKIVALVLAVPTGLALSMSLAYLAWLLRLWLRADAARPGIGSGERSQRRAA